MGVVVGRTVAVGPQLVAPPILDESVALFEHFGDAARLVGVRMLLPRLSMVQSVFQDPSHSLRI
jgi:hypothetical protein